MPTARHTRLVRKIRREEERAARQRAESSLARGELVRQLVADAGSQQAAARELGTSRQAVNKTVQAGEDAWDQLRQAAPALTYLPMAWPKYGPDVIRDDEWAALEGKTATEAAKTARDAWGTLACTLESLYLILRKAVAETTGALNGDADLPDLLEEGLKPDGGDLGEWDYEFVGRRLRPRDEPETKRMRTILMGMESSLHSGVQEAREQQQVWADRA
ncbi:hypothetical protein [Streptomyces microflavus]|uniref:hypothetical protein n=1 Tax=Streptomyces microflavus TaxID=1919 RepID=UPI002E35C134|nr:hypothetical protein [Streptomyces microflavus]